MRSYTTSGAPGRCPRCLILTAQCICADVPQVSARTEVVVVRHEKEAWKSTGTARIAALSLPALRLLEYTEDAEPARSQLPGLVDGAWLLFPREGATSAQRAPSPPRRLIVLDGTWRQTRKMYARLECLHALPRLELPPPPPGEKVLRLRESTFAAGRSTLEAIAEALALLEGEAAAAPLHAVHALYVERVFRARGVWELKRGV